MGQLVIIQIRQIDKGLAFLVVVGDPDASPVWVQKPQNMIEQHRFAATGTADNGDDGVALYLKVDTIQDMVVVEGFMQPFDEDFCG